MDTQDVPTPLTELDLLDEIDRFARMLRECEPATTELSTLARITAFESLRSTVASAQSREAVTFETLRARRDALNDVPARERGVRAGEEVALAKKVSPGAGRKFLTNSRAIVTQLPNTFKALASGEISEDKARIMVDETSTLDVVDRGKVDTRMKTSLGPVGLRSLRTEVRSLAMEMNAEVAAERAEKAIAGRRVTMTPLDDGMGRVSAILPLEQAVAAYEGLKAAADSALAAGDAGGRRHSQLMADTCVERLTGQSSATAVPTEVHVVIEAESLFADGMVPAWMPGFGPLPAKTARSFLACNEAEIFIRRMFTRVTDGQLVGAECRGRAFTGRLRQMVVFRDDLCRTPWCDARIKHADHADSYATGGETSWENGSGLCAACNYAKEHPGWTHKATAEGLNVITPSGQEHGVTTGPFVRRMKYPRRPFVDDPPDSGQAAAAEAGSPEERAARDPAGGGVASEWRQKFAGLLAPKASDRTKSPPKQEVDQEGEPDSFEVESPGDKAADISEQREVELDFLPITEAEARQHAAVQHAEVVQENLPEPEWTPDAEFVELVVCIPLPPTLPARYGERSETFRPPQRQRQRSSGPKRPVGETPKDSCVEASLHDALCRAG